MTDELTQLRKQLDDIDAEILTILAKRMEIIKKVGAFKKEHGITPFQPKRWQAVLESRFAMAKPLHLSESFVKKLFDTIHEYALEIEKKLKTEN